MSARASKHPTHRFDRSNDSTRALAGKDPSTGAKKDTASARFRLDRGIKSTVDDRTREFRRRCRRRSPRRVRRPGVASIFFEVIPSSRRSTRSGKVVSRLARVAGVGKRTCEPRRCASSVRERRSTIPVSVHARFRACAARVELLHGRVTRLFFFFRSGFRVVGYDRLQDLGRNAAVSAGEKPAGGIFLAPV